MTSETVLGVEGRTLESAAHAPWRLRVDLHGLDDRPWEALRQLLVADVLRRVVEELLGDTALLAVLEHPGAGAAREVAHRLAIEDGALHTNSPSEAESFLAAPADVAVVSVEPARAGVSAVPARRVLRVGAVSLRGRRGSALTPDLLTHDRDPLAVRLALLHVPCSSPAVLSLARLHRADETLERWRVKVAGWREMPAAPAPGDSVEAMRERLLSGLDTGAVLRQLHRLEIDPHLASGSKYDAFTSLDRVLALDLRRLVGKRLR